jgi:hypothetical protein
LLAHRRFEKPAGMLMSLVDRIPFVTRRRMRDKSLLPAERLDSLERRVMHLETMVEGLQDSVHREITRMNMDLDDLHARTDPASIRRALSDDARTHGL